LACNVAGHQSAELSAFLVLVDIGLECGICFVGGGQPFGTVRESLGEAARVPPQLSLGTDRPSAAARS
jgi:hypothetical protein